MLEFWSGGCKFSIYVDAADATKVRVFTPLSIPNHRRDRPQPCLVASLRCCVNIKLYGNIGLCSIIVQV
jgi:hypothetical protein